MGAYNVLFHFDKLAKRLGPLRHRFSSDHEATLATPTALFLSSTIAIIWLGVVLAFITFHEMTPGNKGGYLYNGYYARHLFFGCALPMTYAFVVNSEFWWARYITVPAITAFSGFYAAIAFQQSWISYYKWGAITFMIGFWMIFSLYMLFNKNVCGYYAYLRKNN